MVLLQTSYSSLQTYCSLSSKDFPDDGSFNPDDRSLSPGVGSLSPDDGSSSPGIGYLSPDVGSSSPGIGYLSPVVGSLDSGTRSTILMSGPIGASCL